MYTRHRVVLPRWSVLLPFVLCCILLLRLQTHRAARDAWAWISLQIPQEAPRMVLQPCPWCWWAASNALLRCLLHLHSFLPYLLQVILGTRSSRELQTLKGRSLLLLESRQLYTCKENCHIPQLFLSILSSMATPAADNRVWIHCLCAAKGHCTIYVVFAGNRLPEWNIKCWVQNLQGILKMFPWQYD